MADASVPRARSPDHLDVAAVEPTFQALGERFLRARTTSATQPRLPYAVAHTIPLSASIDACWRKPSTMQPGGTRPKRMLRLYPWLVQGHQHEPDNSEHGRDLLVAKQIRSKLTTQSVAIAQ